MPGAGRKQLRQCFVLPLLQGLPQRGDAHEKHVPQPERVAIIARALQQQLSPATTYTHNDTSQGLSVSDGTGLVK